MSMGRYVTVIRLFQSLQMSRRNKICISSDLVYVLQFVGNLFLVKKVGGAGQAARRNPSRNR